MAKVKTEQLKFSSYLKIAVPLYLLFLYMVCQIVKVDPLLPSGEEMLLSDRIRAGLDRITQHPFDIFPLNMEVMGTCLLFGVLGLGLLYAEFLKRKRLRPGIESGSAAWNTNLRAYNKVYSAPKGKPKPDRSGTNNNNVIFSKDVYMSMNTRDTMRNLNTLVCGGSGSGKSRFVVKPNLLQANCSFVVTDPKGELLASTGDFLEKQGYKIKVFNLSQMEHSCSYNPFHYIRDENGVLTMITALIKNTTPKGAQSNDPFWEKAETALLQAICFYLYYECREEERNFTNVMKLLRCLEVREGQEDYDSTLDIMFKMLKEKNPEHIACRQYAVFKQAAGKTAQSIMVSCSVRLTVFNMTSVTNLTSIDNIDLASIGQEKTALFCITPVVDTTFNFLVALLYTQLFETLYNYAETKTEGIRLPVHVRFLLDEFPNIGTIPDFCQKLSTMRSYEISCTIIIQALSQLKAMYEKDWEVLVGNCDSFLFLGGSDATTLEYVSKKLGKETIRSQNTSRNYGSRGGGNSMSYNTTGRELMTPDEISRMPTGDCILFIRGLLPFYGKKYDYPKHPNYKYTGDADKKLNYFAAKHFFTARPTGKRPSGFSEEKKRIRIMAEKADTRDSERWEKMERAARRNPRMYSEKHKPLYEEKPLEEGLIKDLAQQAITEKINVINMEDQLVVADGYQPTMERAFEEFYVPSEEELADMEGFDSEDFDSEEAGDMPDFEEELEQNIY